MKTSTKILLVMIGYVIAFVLACLATGVYAVLFDSPAQQASSGMAAFGDALLFLGVFVLATLPATGLALFFLRAYPAFWYVLSSGSLVVASTSVAALATYVVPVRLTGNDWLANWQIFSPLRLLLAPLLALAFFVAMLFAPTRWPRSGLFCASAMEAVAFACIAWIWFHSSF